MPVRIRSHQQPGMLARSRQRAERPVRKKLRGLHTQCRVDRIDPHPAARPDPAGDPSVSRLSHRPRWQVARSRGPVPAGIRIRLLSGRDSAPLLRAGYARGGSRAGQAIHRHRGGDSCGRVHAASGERQGPRLHPCQPRSPVLFELLDFASAHANRPGQSAQALRRHLQPGGSSAKGQRLRPRRDPVPRRLVVQGLHQVGLFLADARRRAGCPRRRSAGRLRPARPDRALLRRGHLHR